MTKTQNRQKHVTVEENIQSGSGLPSTTRLKSEDPLKIHHSAAASTVAKTPMGPPLSLTTTEQLIQQTKATFRSGDLFMTGRNFILEKIEN